MTSVSISSAGTCSVPMAAAIGASSIAGADGTTAAGSASSPTANIGGSFIGGSFAVESAVVAATPAAVAGMVAITRKPPRGAFPVVSVPPAAITRSRRPTSPTPWRAVSPGPVTSRWPCPVSRISTLVAVRSTLTVTSHTLAPLCRITFVAASRITHPSTCEAAGGTGGPSCRTRTEMPALASAVRTLSSSTVNSGARYPFTASRTSVSARRPIASMSAAASAASAGSRSTRRRTTSAFTTISDIVCPSRSCRSRANRRRSWATAFCASSARVSRRMRLYRCMALMTCTSAPAIRVPKTIWARPPTSGASVPCATNAQLIVTATTPSVQAAASFGDSNAVPTTATYSMRFHQPDGSLR
jgi:hypothetical protein